VGKYSEMLTEHVMAPRNAGVMENPDITGHSGTPGRGAFLTLFLKLNADRIAAGVPAKLYQINGGCSWD
jgi:NifU-like protein involved in Fe-S cluster formation